MADSPPRGLQMRYKTDAFSVPNLAAVDSGLRPELGQVEAKRELQEPEPEPEPWEPGLSGLLAAGPRGATRQQRVASHSSTPPPATPAVLLNAGEELVPGHWPPARRCRESKQPLGPLQLSPLSPSTSSGSARSQHSHRGKFSRHRKSDSSAIGLQRTHEHRFTTNTRTHGGQQPNTRDSSGDASSTRQERNTETVGAEGAVTGAAVEQQRKANLIAAALVRQISHDEHKNRLAESLDIALTKDTRPGDGVPKVQVSESGNLPPPALPRLSSGGCEAVVSSKLDSDDEDGTASMVTDDEATQLSVGGDGIGVSRNGDSTTQRVRRQRCAKLAWTVPGLACIAVGLWIGLHRAHLRWAEVMSVWQTLIWSGLTLLGGDGAGLMLGAVTFFGRQSFPLESSSRATVEYYLLSHHLKRAGKRWCHILIQAVITCGLLHMVKHSNHTQGLLERNPDDRNVKWLKGSYDWAVALFSSAFAWQTLRLLQLVFVRWARSKLEEATYFDMMQTALVDEYHLR